jgi:tetracycline 7-halogenase / FADH2 O2-dependent halogenase
MADSGSSVTSDSPTPVSLPSLSTVHCPPSTPSDVLIIGSGFGGCLTALGCQQLGLRVVVVDARRHPRFAIGESSTPLANLLLESFADRYRLPWLAPLANYASWKSATPQLGVGLKRGFSYFQHRPGEPFRPRADRANELLVAASHGPDDADTHWIRADFDHYLAQHVVAAGIPLIEATQLTELISTSGGWRVSGQPAFDGECRFLIDATGDGGFLRQQLHLPDATPQLQTHSRALFGHFRHVRPWDDIYRELGGDSQPHPFHADDAALHHIFAGGWMWNLRFDHGVTSAGFCLTSPLDPTLSPQAEWQQLLQRFPSIRTQYAAAECVAPDAGLIRTGRLQRLSGTIAGPNWALLPTAAGFIDPLHSTGNAHTLIGIERLLGILARDWNTPRLPSVLQEYARLVDLEIRRIDRIVAGCYRHFADFPRMIAWSLFYFVTAIWSENQHRRGDPALSFLCADDPQLEQLFQRITLALDDPAIPIDTALTDFRQAIAPINLANLGDPMKQNLYPYI